MESSPAPEVVLLTPPLMDALEFPEAGAPQLLGFLRTNAITSAHADLNMELLAEFLASATWRQAVLEGIRSAGARGTGDGLESILPSRIPSTGQDGIELVRRWTESAVRVLGLRWPDLSLEGVAKAVETPHMVYKAFFQQRVFERFSAPRIVGLSLISPTQLHPALLLARMVKEAWPEAFVVVGGPWVVAAERILEPFLLRFPCLDAAILRRGERPLLQLIHALREQPNAVSPRFEGVSNLLFREGGLVQRTRLESPEPLHSLPPPCFDGLALDSYPASMLPIQTNSRCYWGECLFCYHDSPQSSAGERSPSSVAQDIVGLVAQTGVRSYFLADCATPVPWMAQFASKLLDNSISIRWAAMCRAERSITPEVSRQLHRSGCAMLMIGLETVSHEGLRLIRKGIVPDDVENAARCCAEAGIRVHLFLLDFPTNSLEDLRKTLEFVLKISPWVEDFTVQRFQLSMLSRIYDKPELLGMRLKSTEGELLDVFDLPYDAKNQTEIEDYVALAADYRKRFNLLKGRVGSPFVVASAARQQERGPG